ncbi:hypothetical protein Bca52824_092906 [Brassica carinata]|uniref:Surfeit locus protein 2 n=1 Tax=Brassica carinata TaxID=52824 RepID=A0A8X7P5I4_BRACI|nr:hypothetical protein Bca52824_092906 [Brassica carinata]
MAATEEEMTTATKEGANLWKPKYKKLENGRFRCVQTGHELLEKDKKVYSESKRCRLGLIDHALSHSKPPLNLFEQDPTSRSKLLCKLTGDTVNKTEEHIWKHLNGRRFLNKLGEGEKESGSVPEEGGEAVVKEDGRWDFDDGGDRWGSDSEEEDDPIGEIDEDGKTSLEDCIIGEVDEDGENSLDETTESKKRKPEELSSSSLPSSKKNKKNKKNKKVKTTAS